MVTNTIVSYGQWITEDTDNFVGKRGDDIYHCLNRADEKPFFRGQKNDTNSTEELWLQWASTPCPLPLKEYSQWRRCIGRQPDQCVNARSKFNSKGFSMEQTTLIFSELIYMY